MSSQNKLIKQGLKYTDSLFDEISNRLEQGVKASDTLEAFLDKYYKAFPEGNPLLALGYDAEMVKLILSETNNHKFSRPSQKELVRVTIESQVGDLIRDVGEDIRDSVRDIVRDGYNDNLSQDEIAANLTDKVSSIKGRRAKAIARTEIARTATISDYVINKERGATHFYVECRNTACPVCKEAWHKHWSKSNDESFTPSDSSAGGKGWIGDKVYSMSDTMMLPPIHPNCRCVPYFISEDDIPDGITVEKPTPKETTVTTPNDTEPVTQEPVKKSNSKLNYEDLKTVEEVAEYFGFEYSYGDFPQIDDEVLVGNDGKKYKIKNENKKGKYHKFYDRENDCTLYFHQSLNKNLKDGLLIDNTNTGKGVYNLKDVVKMYDDTPKVLKEANTSITFTNRKAKYLGGYNKLISKKWMSALKDNPIFKKVTQGRTEPQGWVDIYKTSIKDDGDGWSLQRLLYHEMAHGLDNVLSQNWGNSRTRFSDNKSADGYGALIFKQRNFNEETRKMEVTPEEIVDGISSEYGQRHYDKTYSYSEDFADCVSVVVFKYVEDKSGAKILPPDWTWENKKPPYTYDEFVKKYPHKVKFIEELLGIDN